MTGTKISTLTDLIGVLELQMLGETETEDKVSDRGRRGKRTTCNLKGPSGFITSFDCR